ncbi:MAG: hypothetical protein K9M45_03725, partial [Kiritimatiellales bacterium]|nr:hypothetical protein [Kiritimatiellales bacterium]
MRATVLFVFLASLLLSGCEPKEQAGDQREEKDPLVKQGQAYMDIKDWDQAEETFKEAADKNPKMARPHLDLATIYHQHKTNYFYAIYHYQRYLELRPESEKTEFIKEQITKVQSTLAAAFVNQNAEVKKLVQQYQRLQQENQILRNQLAALQKPMATTTKPAAKTTQQTGNKVPVKTTTTAATHSIYHVVTGDTLSLIATKFYG